MGGEHAGVSEDTTDVLLEIAYFDPERIARTGQKLGLTSDARSRFERGVDPAFLDDGLAMLTGLILDICGGEASRVDPRRRAAGRGQDGRASTRRARWRWAGSTSPASGSRRSSSGSASRSPAARRKCRAGGATSTARPTWSRKSRASTAMTRSRRPPCRAPRASPGRPRRGRRSPSGGCGAGRRARPRRGGHLELHFRRRGRAVRRRRRCRSPTRSARR